MTPLPFDWLWPMRLALGTLVVLQGKKGVGKSSIACAVAAHATGGPRLYGSRGKPRFKGNVVWYSGEDDPARTICPRLLAAGADLTHVHFPDRAPDGRLLKGLYLPGDLDRVERELEEQRPVVLILDPLSSFAGRGVSLNDEQAVRQMLEPLAHLLHRYGCVGLLTRHEKKGKEDDPLDQGLASVGIVNVARRVFQAKRDPERPGTFYLFDIGGNLCATAPTLEYGIVEREGAALVEWRGVSGKTAQEAAQESQEAGERSQLELAQAIVRQLLAGGPCYVGDALKVGKAHGVSERTMHRARKMLRCPSRKKTGEEEVRYYWHPPKEGFPSDR